VDAAPPPPIVRADAAAATDQPVRKHHPLSTLFKKLSELKSATSGKGSRHGGSKRHRRNGQKNGGSRYNNPYPESGRVGNGVRRHSDQSLTTSPSRREPSEIASIVRTGSNRSSAASHPPPTMGGRSIAPTVSTDYEPPRSMAAPSHGAPSFAGTSRTANGGMESRRGGDSTFSSPSPSVRSLTTTLTTIQSVGPNGQPAGTGQAQPSNSQPSTSQAIQFSQPFAITTPPSAIPQHLSPHPMTYNAATANNVLTDNASIVTLASSSKRRRRRSMDTDASVRALAPSSLFGGSRESLPLSVLSANMDSAAGSTTPGLHQPGRVGTGGAATERTSIYSTTGILASERNSLYAKATTGGGLGGGGDGASVRSGLLGHGRADSVTGSIGGMTSPLVSPREEREKEMGKGVDENTVPEDEE
jgi:hypothetical protein